MDDYMALIVELLKKANENQLYRIYKLIKAYLD